jgi:hypothetical protein
MFRLAALCFALLGATAAAAQNTYRDWNIGRTSDGQGLYAATVNDSGNVFGQYCYSDELCVYLLGITQGCEKGSKYPVLANTDTGSQSLEVYCNGRLEIGRYQYVFTDFNEIHRIAMDAARVGFAMPLKGDEFIVIRFSLMGSNEAVATMNARTRPGGVRRGTRDQRM